MEVEYADQGYNMSNFVLPAELPPRPLLERLAKELRRRLVGLSVHCGFVSVHIGAWISIFQVCWRRDLTKKFMCTGSAVIQLGHDSGTWDQRSVLCH